MSHRYYDMCKGNIGRIVNLRTHDGKVYTGGVARVTQTHLYLTPLGSTINGNNENVALMTAEAEAVSEKGEEVFFFFPFVFAFAAIAALTFSAAATVPFYGYRRRYIPRRFYY